MLELLRIRRSAISIVYAISAVKLVTINITRTLFIIVN